jgi:hypothetical protein
VSPVGQPALVQLGAHARAEGIVIATRAAIPEAATVRIAEPIGVVDPMDLRVAPSSKPPRLTVSGYP